MLVAVACEPIADASTVMYPPSHGGRWIGWPGTPRSPDPGAAVGAGSVGFGPAVSAGVVSGSVGAGAGGAVVTTGRVVGSAVAGGDVTGIGGGVVLPGGGDVPV